MKNLIVLSLVIIAIVSCKTETIATMEWSHNKTIALDNVHAIGLVAYGSDLYLSDGDGNRIVKVDSEGNIIDEIKGFERPMHIDMGAVNFSISENLSTDLFQKAALFVPEYGRDSIAIIDVKNKTYLQLNDSLDAPAAVSVFNQEIAIADFYPNRILYYNGDNWTSIGKEGKALGELNYPTDVQITEDYIYVADAYNHRVQVFDKKGKPLRFIGDDQNMNAATGLYVTEKKLYITDFENNRILVYNHQDELLQILEADIDKPTDILENENKLYITNYRKGELVIYELKEKENNNE